MVGVQGGSFYMGATIEQVRQADVDEQPCHNVAISSFRIGQTEVTQGLWKAVMGKNNNPSKFKDDDQPVEFVTWNDCQEFIKKLNEITGLKFRLPSEAEWEYAARGGNITRQYTFPGSDNAMAVAWNAHNTKQPQTVGRKLPNELGLYDMGGNVAEWCDDWYASYLPVDMTNPQGPSRGSNKVIRGSFWEDGMRYCRPSYRDSKSTSFKSYNIGFRLAL
jgi:formylglycine-generating enzyme required for sulfatase activity